MDYQRRLVLYRFAPSFIGYGRAYTNDYAPRWPQSYYEGASEEELAVCGWVGGREREREGARERECVCVCARACVHLCMYACLVYVCMYDFMCVCVCVCVYI